MSLGSKPRFRLAAVLLLIAVATWLLLLVLDAPTATDGAAAPSEALALGSVEGAVDSLSGAQPVAASAPGSAPEAAILADPVASPSLTNPSGSSGTVEKIDWQVVLESETGEFRERFMKLTAVDIDTGHEVFNISGVRWQSTRGGWTALVHIDAPAKTRGLAVSASSFKPWGHPWSPAAVYLSRASPIGSLTCEDGDGSVELCFDISGIDSSKRDSQISAYYCDESHHWVNQLIRSNGEDCMAVSRRFSRSAYWVLAIDGSVPVMGTIPSGTYTGFVGESDLVPVRMRPGWGCFVVAYDASKSPIADCLVLVNGKDEFKTDAFGMTVISADSAPSTVTIRRSSQLQGLDVSARVIGSHGFCPVWLD